VALPGVSRRQGCLAGSYGLYTAAAGGVALYVFDGARYVVSATARPADVWNGAWHHVAGTFDGRTLRLFVDGRPVGDPMEAPLRIAYVGVSTRASFGQYVGDCELTFRGDMDLVRLWSGARSPQDIGRTAPGIPPPPQARDRCRRLRKGRSSPPATPLAGTGLRSGPASCGSCAGVRTASDAQSCTCA
jgi:hypothetical protein